MKHLIRTRCSGFSLIEVVIAIGIVSFSILAVVGLLPTGLKTVKNANEQAGAANVLNAIAEAIRSATPTTTVVAGIPPATYNWTFAGTSYSYTLGAGASPIQLPNLTLEGGTAQNNNQNARLAAYIQMTPPAFSPVASTMVTIPGTALISVAWSFNPNLTPVPSLGNGSTTVTWTHADGFISTGIQFLPRQ